MSAESDKVQETMALKPCPICGKLADKTLRPFCSKRCADVDLHRWLSGTYAIPLSSGPEEDKATPETDDV